MRTPDQQYAYLSDTAEPATGPLPRPTYDPGPSVYAAQRGPSTVVAVTKIVVGAILAIFLIGALAAACGVGQQQTGRGNASAQAQQQSVPSADPQQQSASADPAPTDGPDVVTVAKHKHYRGAKHKSVRIISQGSDGTWRWSNMIVSIRWDDGSTYVSHTVARYRK